MSRRSQFVRTIPRRLSLFATLCAVAGLLAVAQQSWGGEKGKEKLTAEEKIEKALEQPTSVEFEEESLENVASYLRDLHDIPIVLDTKALGDEGLDPETPCTYSVKQVKLRSVLNQILHDLDLTYEIRNDSAIMLSPQMYRERVAPHDERVLCELGGGGIHCCGKIEHNVGEFMAVPCCECLDLGQPEMNDIDAIYAQAASHGRDGSRKTPIMRLRVDREELTSGSVMQRFPTGVSLMHQAQSFTEAQEIMTAYRRACE